MKNRINQFLRTSMLLFMILFFFSCDMDIQFGDPAVYPRTTLTVTVLDSFADPMVNQRVSIHGTPSFDDDESQMKYTNDEGKVIFENLPVSYEEYNTFGGQTNLAGYFNYDIQGYYVTEDCCYSLGKYCTLSVDPTYILLKIPEDLRKISGVMSDDPEIACNCNDDYQ